MNIAIKIIFLNGRVNYSERNSFHCICEIREKQTLILFFVSVTMDVDNTGPFIAESPEQWALLELKQPLYIGGVPDYDQLPSELAGVSGYDAILLE